MTKKRFFQESELVFAPLSKAHHFKNLTDKTFGSLKVIGYAGKCTKIGVSWYCKCQCGNIKRILASSLIGSKTISCGCLQRSIVKKLFTKHGQSGHHVTTLYRRWLHMMERCSNVNCPTYHHYGGRGIKVCERWHDYENFLADMGEVPKGLTLDRIDVDKDYCPENCRWATWKEQQNNKRDSHFITFNNKTQTIAQWADETGLLPGTIHQRIVLLKWPIEKALTTPLQKRNKL